MVDGLRERIEAWSERSVPEGLTGLATLAEEEFDGVVTAGTATATFVSGRLLHLEGDIEAMEESVLTVKQAPEPELALLAAMTATGGDAQAQYYTEDTDIQSIDERLQSGGFTGYVELSENVLSGSYYRLYYAGTARSLAFVGINDDVLTGTEAFDRTLDEVGIYEVVPIDLSVTDIPEPPEPTGAAENTNREDDAPAGPDAAVAGDFQDDSAVDSAVNPATSADDTVATDAGGTDADSVTSSGETTEAQGTTGAVDDVEAGTVEAGRADTTTASTDDPAIEADDGRAGHSESAPDGATADSVTETPTDGDTGGAASVGTDGVAGADTEGIASSSDADSTASATEATGLDAAGTDAAEAAVAGPATDNAERVDHRDEELDELRHRVAALERQVQTLDNRTSPSSGGFDVDESESETTSGRSPTEALGETDCLVRYETRAGATIEGLLEGESTTEAVRENLRIETNTTFDADATTVEGVPYEEFLAASLERRVVGWLLCELPTEIVATDSRNALADLVEALPTIDRIGFQETIDLESLDDDPLEEEAPKSVGFDLVAWGGDGHPRVVADLSRSTDPVGEGPVSSLIARGKSVATRTDLAAVLFATDGYYEADARRAVEATTGGGLLARDSRASYVKMTRKRGFHCCLAEAYDDAIHLTVPEL